MDETAIQHYFTAMVQDDPEMSIALAAMRTLLYHLETHEWVTFAGLRERMEQLKRILEGSEKARASVSSGTELFVRCVTLASSEKNELPENKKRMLERGRSFLKLCSGAREKIAHLCDQFIMDDMTILTHSRSRVVRDALIKAKNNGKTFSVLVTESQPDCSGKQLCQELHRVGIRCRVILDAEVAHYMESVDCVLVGAEAVVENGGIVNKIGSLGVAMSADAFKRPLYVLTECVKFVRLYPLNQKDVTDEFEGASGKPGSESRENTHLVDFTPPRYITLLFTDLGILTPAAVSDELIQLYI